MRTYLAAAITAIMLIGPAAADNHPATGVDLLALCSAESTECQDFLVDLTASHKWPDRTLGVWISGFDKMQWSLCPPGHSPWSIAHWRNNLPGLFVEYWKKYGDAETLPMLSPEQAASEAMDGMFPSCVTTSAS